MTLNFSKHFSLALLCSGLILVSAEMAFAQNNQTITSGEAIIEQIGSGNLALIQTSENNFTSALQDGNDNNVDVDITGEQNGNGIDNNSIVQTGDNNNVRVTIDGNENLYNISQSSNGAQNTAQLNQTGDFNFVNITQDALGDTEGLANVADVTQIGNDNFASIEQTSLASDPTVFNNQSLITQSGDRNRATSTQSGINNTSEQEQLGNGNTSEILQRGDNNFAVHRQFGDNLSLPTDFGSLIIEQTGGAEIIVEQYSAGNTPPPF